jgi:exosome complex component RRP41
MLDLSTLEENDIPHVTVAVMPKTKKVVLVTMETRLHVERFEEILNLARDAGKILHQEMKEAVLSRASSLVAMGEPITKGQKADDDVIMD